MSPPASAVKASRTASVVAITTDSGPAAASRPLLLATLSKEEVDGGRLSAGHDEGRSRTFASPERVWNPRPWVDG